MLFFYIFLILLATFLLIAIIACGKFLDLIKVVFGLIFFLTIGYIAYAHGKFEIGVLPTCIAFVGIMFACYSSKGYCNKCRKEFNDKTSKFCVVCGSARNANS